MRTRSLLLIAILAAVSADPDYAAAQAPAVAHAPAPTEVVVLGVAHSAMLVAESYQPAVLRAFLRRVAPTAVCIERAPEEYARGSHYEFTYEIQEIVVPWANREGVQLCPFDWMPPVEDQMLAFNTDLSALPFLRAAGTYADFLTYPDSSDLTRSLFHAESHDDRAATREWYAALPEKPRGDFARRLFLYRTFMQSMRIAKAAQSMPGGRLLVVVGSMHKDDIERILADQPGVKIVSPATFGAPTAAETRAAVERTDLDAIATFNILGAQALTGNVDWKWVEDVTERLAAERPNAETNLLQTRLQSITGRITPDVAIARYQQIEQDPSSDVPFTWDGVIDRKRVDSYADPFGNLKVRERAILEQAREHVRAGRISEATAARERLAARLSPLKAAQLAGYWETWIVDRRGD